MSVRCEVKKIDGVYFLSGQLDKTFRETAAVIPSIGEIQMNLKDLISINSGGIREWVLLMHRMKPATITLYECSKIFIDQVNMVKDFIPENTTIMSFYVPYYNEKNQTEKSILYEINKHYSSCEVFPAPKVLDEKGDEMEIDVIEAKYFNFIKG